MNNNIIIYTELSRNAYAIPLFAIDATYLDAYIDRVRRL